MMLRPSDPKLTYPQFVFYGIPCASVLVLELLRQAQHPNEKPIANRGAIIQDISVLSSLCEFLTEPGQNNYQLCTQAKSIFSRSLDAILSNAAPEQPANHISGNGASSPSMNDLPFVYSQEEWNTW
jgi:hypothetical protein